MNLFYHFAHRIMAKTPKKVCIISTWTWIYISQCQKYQFNSLTETEGIKQRLCLGLVAKRWNPKGDQTVLRKMMMLFKCHFIAMLTWPIQMWTLLKEKFPSSFSHFEYQKYPTVWYDHAYQQINGSHRSPLLAAYVFPRSISKCAFWGKSTVQTGSNGLF